MSHVPLQNDASISRLDPAQEVQQQLQWSLIEIKTLGVGYIRMFPSPSPPRATSGLRPQKAAHGRLLRMQN